MTGEMERRIIQERIELIDTKIVDLLGDIHRLEDSRDVLEERLKGLDHAKQELSEGQSVRVEDTRTLGESWLYDGANGGESWAY